MARAANKITDRKPELKKYEERAHEVWKSNILVQKTRDNLTLPEQRMVLYLIQRLKRGQTKLTRESISIKEFCEVCGLEPRSGSNYQTIKDAVQSLAGKNYWIDLDGNRKKAKLYGWINNDATIDKGFIELTLHNSLEPHLLELEEFFTRYSFEYVLVMKSKFSVRLYEILKSYQNLVNVKFEIEELRFLLDVEDEYLRWSNLKGKVIDLAIKDINRYTDLTITYKTARKGRATGYITFHIKEKKGNDLLLSRRLVEKELESKRRKIKKKESYDPFANNDKNDDEPPF